MVENAVHSSPELRAIKVAAEQHQIRSGVPLTYDQYSDLLTSAAQAANQQFVDRDRRVLKHEVMYGEDLDQPTYHNDFGIDSYDVYSNTTHGMTRCRLLRDQFDRLGEDGQRTWDLLTDAQKAIILEPRLTQASPSQRRPQDPQRHGNANRNNDRYPTPRYQAHEHSSAIITAESALTNSAFSDTTSATNPVAANQHEYNLPPEILAHLSSKRDTAHPADPARLLSTPPRTAATPEDVVIDGQRYQCLPNPNQRSVNASIIYSVSSSGISNTGSLVNRCANGGIAGEDV